MSPLLPSIRSVVSPWTCALLCAVLLACGGGGKAPREQPDGEVVDAGRDTGTSDAGMDGETASAPSLWEALETTRAAVRQSPDHLSATAERLVAEKDVQGLFELVRDAVALYPNTPEGFDLNSDRKLAWGVRGTLRSGTGSPRDKAELLAELYTRAGFEASVVSGDALPERIDARPLLLGQTRPAFEPADIDIDWDAILPGFDPAAPTLVDPDGSEARVLSQRIFEAVEPDLDAPDFVWDLERIPLVSVELEGETRYANPLYPDAEFGSPYTVDDDTRGAYAPIQPPEVTVELWANVQGSETQTLVSASFPVADVIGRRLLIQTTPASELRELAFESLESIQRFVPSVTLAGPDVSAEMAAETAVRGDVFTVLNQRFALEEDGSVSGPLGPLGSERDAELEARVASLSVTADAQAFPHVELGVFALDEAGEPVEGLAGAAFEVREGDTPVVAQLIDNELGAPRVLLVFDDSGSLPPEFLGDGRTTFGKALVRDLLDADPEAEIRIASVANGGLTWRSEWTADVPTLDSALEYAAPVTASSDLWGALTQAAETTATTTVLVTDGEAYDGTTVQLEPHPPQASRIGLGPPAVVLQAGTPAPEDSSADRMAGLSGGATYPVSMHDEALAAVVGFLDAHEPAPYRLQYRAPSEGPESREVVLSLEGRDIEATTTYAVPESPDAAPTVFQGLFVTVGTNLTNRVTRRLAGAPFRADPGAQDYEDVFAAFFGSAALAVEGGPVTTAQFADDYLTHKLSLRPLVEAARDGDLEALMDALEEGFIVWPGSSAALSTELAGQFGEESLSFEVAPRFVMTRKAFQFGAGFEQRVDILPLTQFASAADSAEARVRATMATSLQLALVEAARYEQSTLGALSQDASLIVTGEVAGASVFEGELSSDQSARWNTLIDDALYPFDVGVVPAAASPYVMFGVNPQTGSVLAYLPDATGGGLTYTGSPDFSGSDKFFDMMAAGGAFGSPALGFWIALQKAIARQLIIAITAIRNLETVDGSEREAARNAGRDFACDVFKGGVGAATGSLGSLLGRVDALATPFGAGIPCE